MTLKIERNSDGPRKLIRLIGRARSEHIEELKKQGFYECVFIACRNNDLCRHSLLTDEPVDLCGKMNNARWTVTVHPRPENWRLSPGQTAVLAGIQRWNWRGPGVR